LFFKKLIPSVRDYITTKIKDKIKNKIYKTLNIPNITKVSLTHLGLAKLLTVKISVKYVIILTILSFL
jgi:hypothetical protein